MPAEAQTVTPDLFSPTRSSQLTTTDSPLRRTAAQATDSPDDPTLRNGMASGGRRHVSD